MKVFISVDIEGVTGVTSWSETTLGNSDYTQFAEQMTKETIAACEGAIAMGAKEIFVKDAHDSARNIDIQKLPRCVKLMRGWTSTPDSMVAGLDESFDAAIFIGYHSAAGTDGNPLAHTMNTSSNYILVNGEKASEFVFNTYIAADYGVPVVFMSGDKMLCESAKGLVPEIETLAVKEGVGGATASINPDLACDLIKEGVINGLKRVEACKIEIPEQFETVINYKEHKDAKHASFYPGVTQVDSHTIKYTANSVKEFATTRMFIL